MPIEYRRREKVTSQFGDEKTTKAKALFVSMYRRCLAKELYRHPSVQRELVAIARAAGVLRLARAVRNALQQSTGSLPSQLRRAFSDSIDEVVPTVERRLAKVLTRAPPLAQPWLIEMLRLFFLIAIHQKAGLKHQKEWKLKWLLDESLPLPGRRPGITHLKVAKRRCATAVKVALDHANKRKLGAEYRQQHGFIADDSGRGLVQQDLRAIARILGLPSLLQDMKSR